MRTLRCTIVCEFWVFKACAQGATFDPSANISNLKRWPRTAFFFYTSTLYHTLHKACANALAIGAYRLAPSRPSINHKFMNLCNKQYEQSKAAREDTRSSARRYGSKLATWLVNERLSTSYLDMAASYLALLFDCQW